MSVESEPKSALRVLMVGFAVPEEEMQRILKRFGSAPIQTHKLNWSVIKALELDPSVRVDVISSSPLRSYPVWKQLCVPYKRWDRGNGTVNVMLPYINVLLFKHVTRFLGVIAFAIRWMQRRRDAVERICLLYGIHSAHMYATLALGRTFGVKTVVLVSDPPAVRFPGEGMMTTLAKKVDGLLLKLGLRMSDGLIVLTRQLGADLAPNLPALVMEGIIDTNGPPLRSAAERATDRSGLGQLQTSRFVVMYAGGLLRTYGAGLLLEAFRLLPENFELWIFGAGELAGEIAQDAAADRRIVYWGFVENEIVTSCMRRATVLINPRPSNANFTKYSFPSKILEYMTSGRPVISTRLQGIPTEYFDYVIALDDERGEGLAKLLINLSKLPANTLDELGARTRQFVIEDKSLATQGNRMRSFLRSIIRGA